MTAFIIAGTSFLYSAAFVTNFPFMRSRNIDALNRVIDCSRVSRPPSSPKPAQFLACASDRKKFVRLHHSEKFFRRSFHEMGV